MNASLKEIATLVQGIVISDAEVNISMISPISNISPGALVFADGADNLQRAEQSEAVCILVGEGVKSLVKPVIQVAHPMKAFIQLLTIYYPEHKSTPSIHPTAVIAHGVSLGDNVFIGPYVTIEEGSKIGNHVVIKAHVAIGRNVSIGDGTTLYPHVTIYDRTIIGQRVAIHASTVIGSDGFGYTFTDGQHLKIPHVGNVVIGDDVEIGANTVVDRASLGETVIGDGTKIDNLVQVAHSVQLGKHNILCAFTGIAGSCVSGDNVIFAANVGVSDHVKIDDGVVLAARSGVPSNKHLLKGNVYYGTPARPKEKAFEQELSVTRIPGMRKNLQALSEKVKAVSDKVALFEAQSS